MSESVDLNAYSESKYIVLKDKKSSLEFIYVFEAFHMHRDIANLTIKSYKKLLNLDCEVVSGGFIKWDEKKDSIITCGRSTSCRVNSRPEDINILYEQFRNIGLSLPLFDDPYTQ